VIFLYTDGGCTDIATCNKVIFLLLKFSCIVGDWPAAALQLQLGMFGSSDRKLNVYSKGVWKRFRGFSGKAVALRCC
jgi:hypothetical protein